MFSAPDKLQRLRAQLDAHSVDAFIVPTADAHNSEYCPNFAKRRAYISNFTGSAGTALITRNEALLWTDGRYFTQAADELDSSVWTLMKSRMPGVPSMEKWIKQQSGELKIGYDPVVTTIACYRSLRDALETAPEPKTLVAVPQNLVDIVWDQDSRPPAPCSEVWCLGDERAGKSVAEKLEDIRKAMAAHSCQGCVFSLLDDVAWITNLRAADIDFCPVFLAYMIITDKDAILYVAASRLSSDAKDHLANANIQIRAYDDVFNDVKDFADNKNVKFWMDDRTNMKLYDSVHNKKHTLVKLSHAYVAKAVKNQVELDGAKEAHIKDAMAKSTFLSWMDRMAATKFEELEKETEFTVAAKLDALRGMMPGNLGPSFDTISSIGSNCAVIHYKPAADTAKHIARETFLIDSGGQYLEGTTDVTRCLHFGEPSAEEKQGYTLVLKGHLALKRQKFPRDVKGVQLDVIARMALWNVGLNYNHGTGHGVGSVLLVHEGPQVIGPGLKGAGIETDLVTGMIVSNEPGYYEPGKFGFRVENLVCVHETDIKSSYGPFYGFTDLTVIPHSKKLINIDLLTDDEINQLNEYHAFVWKTLEPRFAKCDYLPDVELTLQWLKDATSPISR